MIQRIQSIYLLISTILGVVCLSRPLGMFFSAQGVHEADLFNLWIKSAETGHLNFSPWALFALLLAVTTLTFISIFLFKHRALQMRVVTFSMILIVGYHAVLGYLVYASHANGLTFRPSLTVSFPFIAFVLDYLAYRGILKDELLIKSLDRLR